MNERSNPHIGERFEQASTTKSLTSVWPHPLLRKGEAVAITQDGFLGILKAILLGVVWFFASQGMAAAAGAGEATPPRVTLNQALNVSAYRLADGYLYADSIASMLEYVSQGKLGGLVLNLGGQGVKIDQSNADMFLAVYRDRLATFEKAILQRGFRNIAGKYIQVPSHCGKLASTVPAPLDEISIDQAGFKLKLGPLKHEAVIVESTIAVQDAMDMDIQFRGTVNKRRVIKLRLDVDRIKSSTTPFKPNIKAVSKCVVVLSPA